MKAELSMAQVHRLMVLCREGENWPAIARAVGIRLQTAQQQWRMRARERDKRERESALLQLERLRAAQRVAERVVISQFPDEFRFADDPRADEDHGSPGLQRSLPRASIRSPGSSAAWAVQR